ncbi:MAG: hypothetical protein IKS96_05835 [Fibrobacter sp.]|nr:hypothetical protein [Fibrobacter sp.]
MKKILVSLLVLEMFTFWGCTYEEHCDARNLAEVEYLWSPKLDSIIVDWMPNIKRLTPYYNEFADCEQFRRGYVPQHELLKPCENDAVVGNFELEIRSNVDSFKIDSNMVTLRVGLYAYSGPDAKRYFYSNIENVLFDLYGCSANSCAGTSKIHVYGDSSTFDLWLTPEEFEIVETNSDKPSSLDGYYSYHHFILNIKSPSLSATIKVESDNHCYGHWDSPNVSFPIGG